MPPLKQVQMKINKASSGMRRAMPCLSWSAFLDHEKLLRIISIERERETKKERCKRRKKGNALSRLEGYFGESHNETNLRLFHQRYCVCRQTDSDSGNQKKKKIVRNKNNMFFLDSVFVLVAICLSKNSL